MLLVILVLLSATLLHAQKSEVDIQALADELLSQQDADLNYEEVYENLLLLLSSPLDVNTASVEQLRWLGLLSELQLQNLLAYKAENGNLLSVYELQAVPEFNDQLIARFLPFVKVADPKDAVDKSLWKRIANNDNNYIILRTEATLETRRGFITDDTQQKFSGNRAKHYMRFRNSIANDFSVGITAEQDAGEAYAWSPRTHQVGADFLSYHAQLQNKGRFKNILLGDYQLQVGQGLVLGGAFGGGKGGETINTIRKSNLFALPYTSAAENNYLRGATLTYEISPSLSITPFFSRALRDANQNTDSTAGEVSTALLATGLHRNAREREDRKQLTETLIGGVIAFHHKNVEAGGIVQHVRYSNPLARTANVYNQFQFRGETNTNIGAYLNYSFFNFTLFSEVAKSTKGGIGLVAGTLGSLSKTVDVAILLRNYQPNYYSFYANALAETNTPQNERGVYWGLKYRVSKSIQASGYIDVFEFPWLRYRSYLPSTGYEWLARVQYQPAKTISLSVQLREEAKERNVNADNTFYTTAVGKKHTGFINADYSYNRTLSFKTRLQASRYSIHGKSTTGMTLFQDVTWDVGKIRISGRYALFDTEDFDNRQYVVEKDVWLAYSFPAYNGTGIRCYVLFQYDISRRVSCWLRYAYLRVENRTSLGSGMDETEGNERNDIKLQVRIKL
jgi:hypothetical protein